MPASKKVVSVEVVCEDGERIHLPADAIGAHFQMIQSTSHDFTKDGIYVVTSTVSWDTRRTTSMYKPVGEQK